MHTNSSRRGLLPLAMAVLVVGQLAAPRGAGAFSQSSPLTPMGHEWITVASALELLNHPKPTLAQLAKDKGKGIASAAVEWLKAHLPHSERMSKWRALEQPALRHGFSPAHARVLTEAHDTDEWPRDGRGGYSAKFYKVWSAVMGQRWVDLGGFNVVRSTKCWEAVTQMGDAQQIDHFLRRRGDIGPKGAVAALEATRAAFKRYFVEAALADPEDKELITFRDGGADVSRKLKARKAYFLFGRAAHLLQDSFSAEHGVRDPKMNYKTILDIKSYVCTSGAVGHTHDKPVNGHHGDVIWFHDLASFGHDYGDRNLKPYALAAIVAMQDLWKAFLWARTTSVDRHKAADRFADYIVKTWLGYDAAKVGHSQGLLTLAGQPACDKTVEMPAIATTERARCLKLIKPAGPERDAHLGLAYDWIWDEGGHDGL